jgi:hypothetical protein
MPLAARDGPGTLGDMSSKKYETATSNALATSTHGYRCAEQTHAMLFAAKMPDGKRRCRAHKPQRRPEASNNVKNNRPELLS